MKTRLPLVMVLFFLIGVVIYFQIENRNINSENKNVLDSVIKTINSIKQDKSVNYGIETPRTANSGKFLLIQRGEFKITSIHISFKGDEGQELPKPLPIDANSLKKAYTEISIESLEPILKIWVNKKLLEIIKPTNTDTRYRANKIPLPNEDDPQVWARPLVVNDGASYFIAGVEISDKADDTFDSVIRR